MMNQFNIRCDIHAAKKMYLHYIDMSGPVSPKFISDQIALYIDEIKILLPLIDSPEWIADFLKSNSEVMLGLLKLADVKLPKFKTPNQIKGYLWGWSETEKSRAEELVTDCGISYTSISLLHQEGTTVKITINL